MSAEDADAFSVDGLEQKVVTVTDVQRYVVDPVFVQQTGFSHHVYHAYDLTVADGRHRRRMVMSSELNALVQKRRVQVGSKVTLTVRERFDETRVNGPSIPVVESVAVVGQQDAATVQDLNKLPWNPVEDADHCNHPLASQRSYYMDLWSNNDVATVSDDAQVQSDSTLGDIASEDLFTVREMAASWTTLRPAKPRLLLRVFRRSKLFHYGQPGKADKWPFQLSVVVGDATGCCVCVLWNVMAPRYLQLVQEGSVILVRNFTVKPHYRSAEHSTWYPPGRNWFDIDININATHPRGEISIIDPREVETLHDVRLPVLNTNFVSRRLLRYVPDNYVCDVAGLITFVGAVQRERFKMKFGENTGGFWVKRWLFIQDHSSDLPFVVQLYRGVQVEDFENGLVQGAFIVCRNMRVIQGANDIQSSWQHHNVYVTSTRDTQMYIKQADEVAEYPFPVDDVLLSARQFALTGHRAIWPPTGSLYQTTFTFPPQPTSFEAVTGASSDLKLLPCAEWRHFLEGLSYRETTQVAVQVALQAVQFHQGQGQGHRHNVRRSKRTQKSENEHDTGASNPTESATGNTLYLGFNPLLDASESLTEHGLTFKDETFLTFQWRALNDDLVLNSLRPCRLSSCPPDLSLPTLISGACDARPGEPLAEMAPETARKMVESVNDASSSASSSLLSSFSAMTRYLVLLDACCVDGEEVVLTVNRAFPLPHRYS